MFFVRSLSSCRVAPMLLLASVATIGCTSRWIQLAPAPPLPVKRWQHRCIYSAPTRRMVLFGGKIPGNDYADDVWVLQNATGLGGSPKWVQLFPGGPKPDGRHMPAAVYDSVNNRMIIFGGHSAGGLFVNDVWVLQHANGLGGPATWIPLKPSGAPPSAREWHRPISC